MVLGEKELHWKKLLPVKFFAGLTGIGGGLALLQLETGTKGGTKRPFSTVTVGNFLYGIRSMLIRYLRVAVTVVRNHHALGSRTPTCDGLRARMHRRLTSSTIAGQQAAKVRLYRLSLQTTKQYRRPNSNAVERHSGRASN